MTNLSSNQWLAALIDHLRWCIGTKDDPAIGRETDPMVTAKELLPAMLELQQLRAAAEPRNAPHTDDHLARFTEWLVKQMPAGTVIGDPQWWAKRILAAACVTAPEAPSEPPSAITPDVLLLLNEAQNVVIDQAGMSGNTPERRAYLDGIAERLEHLIDSHAVTKGESLS